MDSIVNNQVRALITQVENAIIDAIRLQVRDLAKNTILKALNVDSEQPQYNATHPSAIIYRFVLENPECRCSTIASSTGLDYDVVRMNLRRLRAANQIVMAGCRNTATYTAA